jgi:hypothetical protein
MYRATIHWANLHAGGRVGSHDQCGERAIHRACVAWRHQWSGNNACAGAAGSFGQCAAGSVHIA